jgi:hypothetical protein
MNKINRVERLAEDIRRATENEDSTAFSGLQDEAIVEILNRAQGRLVSRLHSKFPDDFKVEYTTSTVSGTESYAIPDAAFLSNSVEMVEYSDNGENWYRLRPRTIHSRFSNATSSQGNPVQYIIQNGNILLGPTPSTAGTDNLRITYNKKPRELDFRRGHVTTATIAVGNLTSLTLTDPSTLNTKDVNLDDKSEATLQKVDYVCVVDKNGESVLDNIPVEDYNTSTRVLTMSSGFAVSLAAGTIQGNYIVGGYYATSHCELPKNYERYLLAFTESEILSRDGNEFESVRKFNEVRAYENDIMSVSSQKSDVIDTPLDELWEDIL